MKLWWLIAALSLSGCTEDKMTLHPTENLDWPALRGQWVYINYWAVWCDPCREEIPELNTLNTQLNSTVLGVNFDGVTGTVLDQQIQLLNVQFNQLQHDPSYELGYLRPDVLPATVVFNPEGNLHHVALGPQTESSLRSLQH